MVLAHLDDLSDLDYVSQVRIDECINAVQLFCEGLECIATDESSSIEKLRLAAITALQTSPVNPELN